MLKSNMTNILKLVKKAMELHREDFHIFMSFSGHINQIEITWYNGGWKKGCSWSGQVQIYVSEKVEDKVFQKAFEKVLAASNNNETLADKAVEDAEAAERAEYSRLKIKYA